ncbi:Rep family protein [Streptococcus periodonticum]|uniref:Plasmid replication-like protein n=1 Tax=Streptococcus periodonticum TaxID=2490633 RepID=A0A3S9MR90_9STRE|nr:Rep family protein [Streptococcus periodonticum]AZQ41738.1 plasmid replication-like protein [Streptococcus periodonticum]
MAKKEANLTAIMLVQQLEEEYWLSDDYKSVIQKAKDGNCRPLLEMIIQKLEEHDIIAKEAYIIKHDKDKVTIWNPDKMKNEINDKEEHVHALLKFEKGASLKKIALAIGVEPQYLERLKSGRYGYDNCLAYMVHAKDFPEKYQYSPDEVITVLGESYKSIYQRKIETWVRGRATKKAKETDLGVDWLIEKILAGEISKSNILLTDEYYAIYGQHKRRINEALDTVGERKSYQAIIDLETGNYKKSALFIMADSGVGKTKFSMELIHHLQNIAKENYDYNLSYCLTASRNAFDEYNGQELLLLDDVRGETLTVSDWLKLLDPYMISPISARYHNKMGSAKLIIITSTLLPSVFFSQAVGNKNEDNGQFIRRFDYQVYIPESDKFLLSVPEKNEQVEGQNAFPVFHSYSFSTATEVLDKDTAMEHIINTIFDNMNLKNKKVINASDQTNNDNPNTQQK